MIFKTNLPDPAWSVAIQRRKAVLWVGPSLDSFQGSSQLESIFEHLVLHSWAAVYIDAANLSLDGLKRTERRVGELLIRVFEDEVGPENLPPNRLPIYCLRGSQGSVGPGDTRNPSALMRRFEMLQRAPMGCDVFVVGFASDSDLAGLVEAQNISTAFSRLTVVSPDDLNLGKLEGNTDRLAQWIANANDFTRMLLAPPESGPGADNVRVLVRAPSGVRPIDLYQCIDQSYPITATFKLIPASEIQGENQVTIEVVEQFLADPSSSWSPYAAGIPYPRHQGYEDVLIRQLTQFRRDGPSASFTAWLPAEDGSGATTVLHQVCFDLGREGYPVLIAKSAAEGFDFNQMSTFLTRAADRMAEEGVTIPDVPWIIAFDAQHTQRHWDFITGLCNGLKKLMKSVVVLAVRPRSLDISEKNQSARGANRVLGEALSNTLSPNEAEDLGQHLGKFLPPTMKRSRSDWTMFVADTIRTTIEGRRSLFWVALRFWLFRVPGSEGSMRQWLSGKFSSIADKRPETYRGLLEVAALAKNRLDTPSSLLLPDSAKAVRQVASDSKNALGIRTVTVRQTEAFTFSHPMVAEELLRIAQGDDLALSAVEKSTCLSLLDLELHLLARLIQRPAAGEPESVPVIEELITTGLRVDPREAPRNYQVRDRIVDMLELAPYSLFDASQVFNHHLAKARRHLAVDPPDVSWTIEARREQLELAERHILDAIHNIVPTDEDRFESPLNLQVSLALTYDARVRLEEAANFPETAVMYRRKTDEAYEIAQKLDADNSYVLENYARFKIRQAKVIEPGPERTRLIVDAISLLEWERKSDEIGNRDEPTLTELATAYDLLEENNGRRMLTDLAAQGSEAALVALAKLALRTEGTEDPDSDDLRVAEEYLLKVDIANSTWRSRFALYQIVSFRRRHDFRRRLELLEELDASPEFPWPQQLRLEYAILLYQVGDANTRRKGAQIYKQFKEELQTRSGSVYVPAELRFLADPATQFKSPLRTSMVVRNVSSIGRNYYAIPQGWGTLDIPFRPHIFGRDNIRLHDELDCLVQFSNLGPQAVPPTTE